MKWSKEQELAINTEGSNILVSAGAGSGKTAVLTARVTRKLRQGVSLDNLLILTFTNAAASEMKERIRMAINKDESLKDQLELVDNADICTFDAYSLSLVKKYHYLLNLTKDLTIVDNNVITLKKKAIVDEIFDELYERKDKEFLSFAYDFIFKNDEDIKKSIIELSKKMDLIIGLDDYLDNYFDTFYNDQKLEEVIRDFLDIVKEDLDEIASTYYMIESLVESSEEEDYFAIIQSMIEPVVEAKGYDELVNAIHNVSMNKANKRKNIDEQIQELKKKLTQLVNSIKKVLIYENEKIIRESFYKTKNNVSVIIKIIRELEKRITKYKLEKEAFSFMDISKLAIRLLEENPAIRKQIKDSLNEILVDEYQDTSDVQETFISLIASNNVYMVGDIKQSIYRFRNANPSLFMEKYELYQHGIKGQKIDLNKNFRSRREVLDDINLIFKKIMTIPIGGANYMKDHIIDFGNTSYEEEGKTNQNQNLEIYNYDFKDPRYKGYHQSEIDAFIIARDIKDKISEGYEVFDKELKKKRPIKYDDISILIDKTKHFNTFKKVFEYFNIPLSLFINADIKESHDTLVFKNALKLVFKYHNGELDSEFRHSFMSVARSFIFEYEDQLIYDIFKNKSYFNNSIYISLRDIIDNYDYLSLSELVKEVVDSLDFYYNIIKNGDVQAAKARIDAFIKISADLEALDMGLEDFIKFLDDINEAENLKLEIPLKASDNACKIMTIHKSKGLEFPLCYFPSFSNKFNIQEPNGSVLFRKELGIITPFFGEYTSHNILRSIYRNLYIQEEVSEKMRLLYVALTRTREKMIIVGSFDREKEEDYSDSNRVNYRSLNDTIESINLTLSNYFKDIDFENVGISDEYNLVGNKSYKDKIDIVEDKIKLITLPSKSGNKETLKFSGSEASFIDHEVSKAIEYGNYLHELLYLIDFKSPNIGEFNLDKKNTTILENFLNNPLLSNLSDAKIYKEYEFFFTSDNKDYHGFIDLMLEYEDHIKIIDYKLKDIDNENYLRQLKGYREFLTTKTSKTIELYLFSLIDNKYKKID